MKKKNVEWFYKGKVDGKKRVSRVLEMLNTSFNLLK
jgi:hypothetical protein